MCPVKMGVDPESIKAPKPVPADWYKIRVKQLKAKMSKSGAGINYEVYGNVVENKPDLNDSFILFRINNGPFQGFSMVDFCHGCGLHIEKDGTFPGGQGAWIPDPKDPENVEKYQYKGPLLGKVYEAEVITTNYNNEDRNSVKQIRCKIEGCATKFPDIKHRLDLIGKQNK